MEDIIKSVAFLLSLAGIYAQTKKKMIGWYIHLCSNTLWIIMLVPDKQWVLVVSFVIYSTLNVYGIIQWRKDEIK